MLSLFKLKKKSKKVKDDEKENVSSPTKVKKVDKVAATTTPTKTSDKTNQVQKRNSDNKNSQMKRDENNNVVVEMRIEDRRTTASPNQQNVEREKNRQEAIKSPLSAKSNATIIEVNYPRVHADSDAAHSLHFHRGTGLSSTISGSDLNRYINSGYLNNAESYLQRGTDLRLPKSPHFHRPANFSYKNAPNYITPRSKSSHRETSHGIQLRKRGHSASAHQDKPNLEKKEDEESDEAIRLSTFSGGYVPDPHTPRKIESLDWPGPPYPPVVPELRNRSRSSSNRHAQNVVRNVNGDKPDEVDSDKENEIKPKPYNNLFDNDYYNYLLRFKSYKDWHKLIEKNKNQDKEELVQQDQINNSQHKEVLEEEDAKGKNPRRLKLDPWKASRTPSASIEPKVRTRYESPVNASPSRMCRSSTYMSNTSGYNLSRLSNGTNSAVYIEISQNNPNTTNSSTPQNNPKSATLPIQKQQQQQQTSTYQVPHQTFFDPTNNSNYRLVSTPITALKPGYGLTNKSITLPNQAKFNGLSLDRTVDYKIMNSISTSTSYNDDISTELREYKVYPYDLLKVNRKQKLPNDVDRKRLEKHLSDQEFKELFGMNKEHFNQLSYWKRVFLKKLLKLF